MATIDDVMDKLGDVLDKIDDVLEKCSEIKSQNEIWDICTTCKGLGYTIGYDLVPGGERTEVHYPCPTCSQSGKLRRGELEGG